MTQGAPKMEVTKLKAGSPVGRLTKCDLLSSAFHIGAGPGHESVIIPSARAETRL